MLFLFGCFSLLLAVYGNLSVEGVLLAAILGQLLDMQADLRNPRK
jgi:hypothetical protein